LQKCGRNAQSITTRIETRFVDCGGFGGGCRNAQSITTRIETGWLFPHRMRSPQVEMLNPLQQGLKRYAGTRNVTIGGTVEMLNPLQQGLKPPETRSAIAASESRNAQSITTRIETQCLYTLAVLASLVEMLNPLQQGLKHPVGVFLRLGILGRNAQSITTRIETTKTIHAPTGAALSKCSIHYNKD